MAELVKKWADLAGRPSRDRVALLKHIAEKNMSLSEAHRRYGVAVSVLSAAMKRHGIDYEPDMLKRDVSVTMPELPDGMKALMAKNYDSFFMEDEGLDG